MTPTEQEKWKQMRTESVTNYRKRLTEEQKKEIYRRDAERRKKRKEREMNNTERPSKRAPKVPLSNIVKILPIYHRFDIVYVSTNEPFDNMQHILPKVRLAMIHKNVMPGDTLAGVLYFKFIPPEDSYERHATWTATEGEIPKVHTIQVSQILFRIEKHQSINIDNHKQFGMTTTVLLSLSDIEYINNKIPRSLSPVSTA